MEPVVDYIFADLPLFGEKYFMVRGVARVSYHEESFEFEIEEIYDGDPERGRPHVNLTEDMPLYQMIFEALHGPGRADLVRFLQEHQKFIVEDTAQRLRDEFQVISKSA